jgi:hypothetical protein
VGWSCFRSAPNIATIRFRPSHRADATSDPSRAVFQTVAPTTTTLRHLVSTNVERWQWDTAAGKFVVALPSAFKWRIAVDLLPGSPSNTWTLLLRLPTFPAPPLAKFQAFSWRGLSDTPAMSPPAHHCAATSPVETTVFTCLANRFQCPHGCTLIETIPHAVRAKFDRQHLRVSAGSAHLNLSMPHGALAPSPVSLRESRFHCAARCAPCKVILAALRSTAGAP